MSLLTERYRIHLKRHHDNTPDRPTGLADGLGPRATLLGFRDTPQMLGPPFPKNRDSAEIIIDQPIRRCRKRVCGKY